MTASKSMLSIGDPDKAKQSAAARALEIQPPATEIMEVVEGVTLTEGAKVKVGPQRKSDGLHMSRKDFQVRIWDIGEIDRVQG